MSAPHETDQAGACPPVDELFAFAVGRLAAADRERLAGHLEQCDQCLAMLEKLPDRDDALLAELRQPVPADLFSRGDRLPMPGPLAGGASLVPTTGGADVPPLPLAGAVPADAGVASSPVVPGYELLGELGRGGMGVVYRAREIGLNRPVAPKMIRAGASAGPQERARLQIEAEAVARVPHPHIVQIYALGQQEDCPYLAQEYIAVRGGPRALHPVPWPRPPRNACEH